VCSDPKELNGLKQSEKSFTSCFRAIP